MFKAGNKLLYFWITGDFITLVCVRTFQLLQDCHLLAPPGITDEELGTYYPMILSVMERWITKTDVIKHCCELLSMLGDRTVMKEQGCLATPGELLYFVKEAIPLHHHSKPLQRVILLLLETVCENCRNNIHALQEISTLMFQSILDNLLLHTDDMVICTTAVSLLYLLSDYSSVSMLQWREQIITHLVSMIDKRFSTDSVLKSVLYLRKLCNEDMHRSTFIRSTSDSLNLLLKTLEFLLFSNGQLSGVVAVLELITVLLSTVDCRNQIFRLDSKVEQEEKLDSYYIQVTQILSNPDSAGRNEDIMVDPSFNQAFQGLLTAFHSLGIPKSEFSTTQTQEEEEESSPVPEPQPQQEEKQEQSPTQVVNEKLTVLHPDKTVVYHNNWDDEEEEEDQEDTNLDDNEEDDNNYDKFKEGLKYYGVTEEDGRQEEAEYGQNQFVTDDEAFDPEQEITKSSNEEGEEDLISVEQALELFSRSDSPPPPPAPVPAPTLGLPVAPPAPASHSKVTVPPPTHKTTTEDDSKFTINLSNEESDEDDPAIARKPQPKRPSKGVSFAALTKNQDTEPSTVSNSVNKSTPNSEDSSTHSYGERKLSQMRSFANKSLKEIIFEFDEIYPDISQEAVPSREGGPTPTHSVESSYLAELVSGTIDLILFVFNFLFVVFKAWSFTISRRTIH
jgi:hypothetical protein